MATEVASLFGTLRLNDDGFQRGLKAAEGGLDSLAGRMDRIGGLSTRVGGVLTAGVTAPLVAAGGAAIKFGIDFENSMANAFSITQVTGEEAAKVRDEVLKLGATATMGPQAVADAYYDIVSGVQDASTHMNILSASIGLAEAGQADLAVTTDGLINTMNAYGFSAEEAGHVSDVFARTVQMGKGSLNEFVDSLGPLGGLADDVGVSFEELGAAIAFSTTRGDGAAESATQLRQAMVAFLNPNTAMTEALAEMGYESGSAALEALGLRGAMQELARVTGSTDNMAKALGSVEALGAGLNLTHDDAEGFFATYNGGISSATDRMGEFQAQSPVVALREFMAALQAAAIALSASLLPPLTSLLDMLTPLILQFGQADPALQQLVVGFAVAAAAVGPLLIGVGQLIGAVTLVGPVLAGAGAAVAAVAGPLLALGAVVAAFAVAWNSDFMGIQTNSRATVSMLSQIFVGLAQRGIYEVQTAFERVTAAIAPLRTGFDTFFASLQAGVGPAQALWTAMQAIYNEVILNTTMAQSLRVAYVRFAEFVMEHVVPAVQRIEIGLNGLGMAFEVFKSIFEPVLEALKNWFVSEGMPKIIQAFSDGRLSVEELQAILAGLWDAVKGPLGTLQRQIGVVIDSITEKFKPLIQIIDDAIAKFNNLKNAVVNAEFDLNPFDGDGVNVGIPGRASGGPVAANQPYLVGEEGPELMVPSTAGTIIPNDFMGGTTNNTVVINVYGLTTQEQADGEIARWRRALRYQGIPSS